MLTGTTAFAAENPFATVPKDYWAYTAVEQLVSDGLVDGYNLEDFHDKKLSPAMIWRSSSPAPWPMKVEPMLNRKSF